jgi:ElaB/YqjD/DUF883 family membrane-anchored ribosome-binding protein
MSETITDAEAAMENSGSKTPNGNFREEAQRAGEQAMAELDHLRERVGDIGERVVGFIKERPGTSLLIAAAAGYLIGRLLRS